MAPRGAYITPRAARDLLLFGSRSARRCSKIVLIERLTKERLYHYLPTDVELFGGSIQFR
jgi:hypothetical protein